MKYILVEWINEDKQYYATDNLDDILWQIGHICKMRGIEVAPETTELVEIATIKHSKGITSVSEFILDTHSDILQLFRVVDIV